MNAIQLNLATFPLMLTCIADGTIALTPTQQFKAIIDGKLIFDMGGFSVDGEQYPYNTGVEYKDIPLLKEWLQSFQLEMPRFQHSGFTF